MSLSRLASLVFLALFLLGCSCQFAAAQFRSGYARRPYATQGTNAPVNNGGVYPEFRSRAGVIRWIKEQMPLKVYVSPGLTLDEIMDPQLGAPKTNVDNRAHWPDVVAEVLQNPEQLHKLPVADGFLPQHYQAALAGINSWKPFEKEGIFSFVFTNDPSDADIYFFWTNHFVNQLGLGLFVNDIRGYTSKMSFSYKAIMAGQKADFKPVVSILRTTDQQRNPMPFDKMRASAAHEFGHALGIEGHSQNPNDLMSVYYGHGVVSSGDAATIRYLYHLTPDLIP